MSETTAHIPQGVLLYSADEIASRVSEIAAEVVEDYRGQDLRLITVLKGGLFFLADLSRAITTSARLDFMAISSYGAGSSGVVRITKDLEDSIEGAHVLIVEDVVDTGLTLRYVLKVLQARSPASIKVCAMFDKRVRRIVNTDIAYCGFHVPDKFLVGYGLDYLGRYRNLPDVYSLDDSILTMY